MVEIMRYRVAPGGRVGFIDEGYQDVMQNVRAGLRMLMLMRKPRSTLRAMAENVSLPADHAGVHQFAKPWMTVFQAARCQRRCGDHSAATGRTEDHTPAPVT